jgi:D-alanyl-D-alanine carboxypeptidase
VIPEPVRCGAVLGSCLLQLRTVRSLAAGCLLLVPLIATAATAGLTGAAAGQIDSIITKALSAGPIPGVSVAVEHHGKVVYQKGFGYSDLENHVKVTPATVFPIGSITKTMTGLAIAQLVTAGKIDLEAPAGRYLPDLPPPARDVKVRFLLEHTSGLVNYTDIDGFPAGSQQPQTRKDIVGWFAGRALEFPAGTRWSYTNSGLYVLGLIIEAVSGESYEDYLTQHEFVPFGMRQSSLAGWQTLVQNRAHGYMRGATGLVNAPRYDPLMPFAAGAVMSTTGDLLRYRHGVFGGEATSAAVSSQLLRRERLPDGFELPYTLGCLVVSELAGHRRIGHPGDIYGFSAQYSYYPDDDLTVVILTNTQSAPFSPSSLELKIVRVVLGLPAPPILDVTASPQLIADLAGDYAVTDMRFGFDRLGFVVKDGALQMQFGGGHAGVAGIPLRYQGGNVFVSSLDDEQRIEFSPAGKAARMTIRFYGSPLTLAKVVPQEPSSAQH